MQKSVDSEAKPMIQQKVLTGERALYRAKGLKIQDTIFSDGESPLKESEDLELDRCSFQWKYPLWYSNQITVRNSTWFEMGRAGVWYTDSILVEDSAIAAPKNFRRCNRVSLKRVSLPHAEETLWYCNQVSLQDVVVAQGDYFAMGSTDMEVHNLTLYGNYSFDGVRNVTISHSHILSKDAFWNSENVTVYDSYLSGEYLGWNAKNLTLINCTIESLQGFCYIDNLVLKQCRLLNTTLAFEYSTVEAEIEGSIDSVLNPTSGSISAQSIGELILERDKIDPDRTRIVCRSPAVTL